MKLYKFEILLITEFVQYFNYIDHIFLKLDVILSF